MGTIADKARTTLNTKNAFKQILIDKEIEHTDVFSTYPDLFKNMGPGITFFPDGLGTFYFQDTEEPRKVFYTEKVLKPASPEIVGETNAQLENMKKDGLFYTISADNTKTTVKDFDGNQISEIELKVNDIDLEGNYYSINGKNIEKYNKNEELVWRCNLSGKFPWETDYNETIRYVRVDADGNVYVGTSVSNVIKISSSGSFLWVADVMRFFGSGGTPQDMKVSKNNNYVFIQSSEHVIEVTLSGTIKWRFATGQYGTFGIADDAVYVLYSNAGRKDTLYKIPMDSADGSSVASHEFETSASGNATAKCDASPETGNCYVISKDGNLYKFDSSLGLVWSFLLQETGLTFIQVVCLGEFVYVKIEPEDYRKNTKKIKESDLSYWIAHFE